MLTIDCTTPTIALRLPLCAATPTAATLSQPHGASHDLSVVVVLDPLPPEAPPGTPTTGQVTLGDIPETLTRGVWTLSLVTACGCFNVLVYVDLCRAPALIGTHTGVDIGTGPVIACCEPSTTVGHILVGTTPTVAGPLDVDGNVTDAAYDPETGVLLVTLAPAPLAGSIVEIVGSYGVTLDTAPIVLPASTAMLSLPPPLLCDTYAISVLPPAP